MHFTNELPPRPRVHWHGVRVPIEMDGVPGISQPDVKTGESFTYDFVLRDAGLVLVSPARDVGRAGGLRAVRRAACGRPGGCVGVADQLTLVLSDIGFDAKGVLEPADSGGSAGNVFGREGSSCW